MTKLGFRSLFALGFAACASGLLFALFLQHVRNLEPCPMCIFQRVAMLGAGLVFLAGAIHAPRAGGRWGYVGGAVLMCLIGIAIAGRHVWLQHLPEDQVPACGPTLDYLLGMMPLSDVVSYVMKGEGSCAKINAAWLGIGLPAWTLAAFVGLGLLAIASPFLGRDRNTID